VRRSRTEGLAKIFRKSVASTSILAMSGVGAAPRLSAEESKIQPKQTKTPNILYIVADDLGYSDIGAFGGEINTPNLDQLVKNGRILTNFHTSPVSAVTRAMMYSGTDHHLVGEGTMGEPRDERKGLPGYEGYLNNRAASVAQLLKDAGYHTYISGKWHLGEDVAKGRDPSGWGFEQSYVVLGGFVQNHFVHEAAGSKNWAHNGQYVQPGQPGQPGGDGKAFFDADFYTEQIIQNIDANKADGKPFLAFVTYTSPHWPLQAPEPYLSKYRGKYDVGYDVIREQRLKRMKQLGIIPASTEANPGVTSEAYPRWEKLTAEQRKVQARYMEIYAGMVENLDHDIGLLIQHLKDIGEYDKTFIVFHSDNGAEASVYNGGGGGSPTGAAGPGAQNGGAGQAAAPPQAGGAGAPGGGGIPGMGGANTDNSFGNLGKSGSFIQYSLRWAEVSAAPFRLFKGHTTEGGNSVPMIVHLPGQQKELPISNMYSYITDMTPTLLELAGVAPPAQPAPAENAGMVVYKGRNVYPVTGLSMLSYLEGKKSGALHLKAVEDEYDGEAFIQDGPWKAVLVQTPFGPGNWELFNTETDRGELKNLGPQNPERLSKMVEEWKAYMKKVGGVLPSRYVVVGQGE
jgi:arylsulfatase A-like enzyme